MGHLLKEVHDLFGVVEVPGVVDGEVVVPDSFADLIWFEEVLELEVVVYFVEVVTLE